MISEKKEPLLKVRNLNKIFYSKKTIVNAVNNVSFNLHKGEILGLIGESGSGKTTIGNVLIRLYENYSGLVTLNDNIISGKKLTKENKKILHKNMQMIFQDPHAALNPQKNVFGILKESLVINKVMVKEFKDLFSDWVEIIENFKYSFTEKFEKTRLENLEMWLENSSSFINIFSKSFSTLEFSDLSVENMYEKFDYLFSILDIRQSKENVIVNNFFDSNSHLIDYFYEHQKKYRNDECDVDETALKEARNNLAMTKEFATKSLNKYLSEKELKEQKTKLKQKLHKEKENKKNKLYILESFVQEFSFESKKYERAAITSHKLEDYKNIIKYAFLYKKAYYLLKKNLRSVLYLSEAAIDKMISSYKEEIREARKILKTTIISVNEPISKTKKLINKIFHFNFLTYIKASSENHESSEKETLSIKERIKVIEITLKESNTAHKTKEDVIEAEKRYKESLENFNWSTKEFKKEYDKRMEQISIRYAEAKAQEAKNNEQVKIIMDKFDKYLKDFFICLENVAQQNSWSKVKTKQIHDFFNNKIKDKMKTLKSFEIEIKNLNNDLNRILYLIGYKKSNASKISIKNILMKNKIYSILEEVGLLRQFAWRYPHEFSGGQRQRIVIARALISEPKLIIADEPIASLDISIQAQIVNLLRNLCKKKNVSLIFIAHDLSMVEYIADYVCIMHLGRIVEAGKVEEIYANPLHPYTLNLFDAIPKIKNSNIAFKASSFDTEYLEEQKNKNSDFYKYNESHYLYSTVNQFIRWTKRKPKLSAFSSRELQEELDANDENDSNETLTSWTEKEEKETLLLDITNHNEQRK